MTQPKLSKVQFIGAASCWGAHDPRCELGPDVLKSLGAADMLNTSTQHATWRQTVRPDIDINSTGNKSDIVYDVCGKLAHHVYEVAAKHERFVVFGGDHSCAIGTWSGARRAAPNDHIGLIWIDAHMDSHIPETSPSGNLHGMPLACLLGHGEKRLVQLGDNAPTLLPQNVCLIGIRSYEKGEATLLNMLGVRVFYMQEVIQKGFAAVFSEALALVKSHTTRFGISIDLDAVDPSEAPGVGSPAQNGLHRNELNAALSSVKNDVALIGMEITELNPEMDENNQTAQLALSMVKTVFA